jgi:hypothetical protein
MRNAPQGTIGKQEELNFNLLMQKAFNPFILLFELISSTLHTDGSGLGDSVCS